MDDIQFPSKTADEVVIQPTNTRPAADVELPGGVTVWVQTLNSIHRDEAQREANLMAARDTRKYRKNGDAYESCCAEVADWDVDKQAAFIVESELLLGNTIASIIEKFPMPMVPERGTEDEAEFSKKVEQRDAECETVRDKRTKAIDKARRDALERNRNIADATRVTRCVTAIADNMFQQSFALWFTLECLLRAVRRSDDHRLRYFSSIDEIRELDDSIRDTISSKYHELDILRQEQLPT